MKTNEVATSARLEGVYAVMRKLQATHNTFETKCVGSGGCCDVGLRVHLSEAWNIARNLRRLYWLTAENQGIATADEWWRNLIDKLEWNLTEDEAEWDAQIEETPGFKCVFYSGGCTIYEFRPLVCRSYGVISPVQEGVCKRQRLSDGGHELIRNEEVDRLIVEFDNIIEKWGKDTPELDYSIHIAAGVLRFLLNKEEFAELVQSTDSKFWMGAKGYSHQLAKTDFETPVKIERKK